MRTRRIQYLRPDEILKEVNQAPVAYLPLGLLEWHGPHLPLGVDSINAENMALKSAVLSGGLVMPTVYFGTERERSPEVLDWLGFKEDEWITGMDFPKNSLPSMYASEETFALIVRENIRLIAQMGFRIIVLISGHAATNQIETLTRLEGDFNAGKEVRVITALPFVKNQDGIMEVGHASRIETSVMLALAPDTVKLDALPENDIALKNTEFAIVDYPTFLGQPTEDRTVRNLDDPREASAEEGELTMERACLQIVKKVKKALSQLEN